MQLPSALQLGSVTNLLNGYRPAWNPSDPNGTPLFTPPQALVNSYPADIPNAPAEWSYPIVTLHPTIEDLVSTLYAYRVVALHDDASPPTVPSGPLTVADADRNQSLKTLGDALGLDLSNSARSYMLARLVRQVGSASYAAHDGAVFVGRRSPTRSLQRGLQVALARVPTGSITAEAWMTGRLAVGSQALPDPTLAEVQEVLAFFNTYGTHYVSSITGGDVIYQVFAYDPAAYQRVQLAYDSPSSHHTGPGAVAFEYYTTPVNGPYGFTAAAGDVLAMSGNPVFVQSVRDGAWNDGQYAGGNSVFHAFQDGTSVNLNAFARVVPIALELSSLTNFAEPQSKDTLRGVFKAALYQKYGDGITPAFAKSQTYDYAAIFPEGQLGFVSTIATPFVDVYKERLRLADVQLVAPEEVSGLTLFTNVLQLSGSAPLVVPGKEVTLVSHVVDVPDPTTGVPTMQLSDAAYDTYTLACQEFGGPVNVVNTSGSARHVIVDGFRYGVRADAQTGRWNVVAEADVRVPPSAAVLQHAQMDIDMSLTAAQAVLGAGDSTASGAQGCTLILKYLNWIGLAIPADAADPVLLELRVRALYLARVVAKLRLEGSPVPYLTYATYQPIIDATLSVLSTVTGQVQDAQQQIQLRKLAELQIDVATELNQNIVQTGELLTGLIGDMAQQQGDMSTFYGQMVAQQQQHLKDAESTLAGLSTLLSQQQAAVSQAVITYQDAVADWETMQIVSFALDLAGSLFTLGAAIAAPAAGGAEVAEAAAMAEKIKKLSDTFDALNKIYQTLLSGIEEIEKAQAALSSIGYDGAQFPTDREWQELSVNVGNMLNNGPDIPAKATLQAAFDILVIRGQALLAAQADVQQIAGEVYLNAKRQQMSAAQQARLTALQGYLHPASISQLDKSKIDLLGLTGSLLSVQQQMLVMLSRSLELQNQALRYEYLQQPVPVTSFDLLSLKQVMLAQKQAIVNGLSSLNPPPEPLSAPVVYTIRGIAAAQMTGGSVFRFTIPLAAREFYRYAMVRVRRVVASVSGVKGTSSGEYLLNLHFTGDPFYDRDQNRATLEFVTPARDIQYLYQAESNEALFGTGTGAWQDSVSCITPFSTWEASFPESSANKGIAFTGTTVDLSLSFDLVALLRDERAAADTVAAAAAAAVGAAAAADPQTGGVADGLADRDARQPAGETPIVLADAGPPASATSGALLAAAPSLFAAGAQPSITQVLAEMNQIGSVMNGWDVVFTMTESLVNRILLQQYNNRANDPTFFNVIPNNTYISPPNHTTGISTVTEFAFTLGTPEVQFLQNNPGSVQLTMEILAGTYGFGFKTSEDGPTTWIDPVAPVAPGSRLQATVPLAQVQGAVQEQTQVVLQLAKGAFTTNNTTITDSNNPEFNTALTNYMVANSPIFLINTISFAGTSLLAGLTPTRFQLNTLQTNSGLPVLQMFITTDGTARGNPSLAIGEPLPVGYGCSLLINSRILFGEVFVQSFKSGNSALTVSGVAPGGTSLTAAYSAEVSSGSFSADVPPTNDVRISENSNTVTLSLTGMTFSGSASGTLQASYDQNFTQNFQYYNCTTLPPKGASDVGETFCNWYNASLPVEVKSSFSMPIIVTGAGTGQSVQIMTNPANVTLTPTLDASGPCKCNNRDVQEDLNTQMNASVPKLLTTALNMTFSSVSLFALENLLFPNNSYITLSSANAPGDMVIFGTIQVPT